MRRAIHTSVRIRLFIVKRPMLPDLVSKTSRGEGGGLVYCAAVFFSAKIILFPPVITARVDVGTRTKWTLREFT